MSNELSLLSSKELADKIKKDNATAESIKANVRLLEAELSKKLPDMTSASLRDINQIIWPFIFSTGMIRTSSIKKFAEKNITVTNEAGFVATKVIKQVFERVVTLDVNDEEVVSYKLIDTMDANADLLDELKITISDPQSGRNFFKNPMPIQNIGDAQYPTPLEGRPMILPNSAMKVEFYNNGAKEYYACVSILGYRLRVENADTLLSLVAY